MHLHVMEVVAVVCVVLLQYINGVPIMKRPESSVFSSEGARIHKRSSAVVEFLMNHESHRHMVDGRDTHSQLVSDSESAYNNDFICPETVATGINDPIYKRSTCPWYYSYTHDPKRFPAVVVNAERLCDYAIGSTDSADMYECVPITHTIDILKQQNTLDQNKNYVWRKETMTIVIGFTSSGRRFGDNAASTTMAPASGDAPWVKR